ncbi:hypothetical protein SAMN05720606_11142 [Paenibacillus polysaccharolyticus]|uniref:Uncharacterized protein n=1 Tax=Paenibacillus polysaccharolyticus TaxID=582692 RepID=A0A1G5JGP6_9BACL|nr:hypothetical protein [Paenibacillus polysaccharolyticus]SCY87543.1 hypothetical protein SAMN05720606_11142 [Paenibacillus polysaccharolyticus]
MFSFQKKSVLICVVCIVVVTVSIITYMNVQSKPEQNVYTVVHLPANSITFSEVEKLDAFAELIVIGYATDGFADREHVITAFDDGTMQSFHTNTNIKIKKIVKKPEDFPSDQNELTIIEPVSLDGDIKYTANDYVELQQGETSVIFLLRNSYGDYGLINDNLGKFSLEGISQYSLPESSTSQQLSEYSTFRDFVMKKYNLNQDS